MPAVEIQHLSKSFRRGANVNQVLHDLDLTIPKGECVVLAGPSGCGKTTLLSILGCTLSADAGIVRLFGEDVTQYNARQLEQVRRETIGFLFQRFHLIRGLSALENVYLPLVLNGVRRNVAKRTAIEQLDAVGLADQLHDDPRRMSVGECQRVALARALAGQPELILADEPTASLDAPNGATVMRLIRQLTKQQGKTAIIVTHDNRVEQFADRVVQMEDGRLSARQQATLSEVGKPRQLQTTSRLKPMEIQSTYNEIKPNTVVKNNLRRLASRKPESEFADMRTEEIQT